MHFSFCTSISIVRHGNQFLKACMTPFSSGWLTVKYREQILNLMCGFDFKLTPVKGKKTQSQRKDLEKSPKRPIVRSQARLVKEERDMITRDELGSWLWGAADILRAPARCYIAPFSITNQAKTSN